MSTLSIYCVQFPVNINCENFFRFCFTTFWRYREAFWSACDSFRSVWSLNDKYLNPIFFFIWSIIQLSKNVHRTIKTINYRYVKTKQELKTICSVWTLLIMVLLFFIRGAYRFLPTACFRKNLRFSLFLRILYKTRAWF